MALKVENTQEACQQEALPKSLLSYSLQTQGGGSGAERVNGILGSPPKKSEGEARRVK